jgi:hypothetical protein
VVEGWADGSADVGPDGVGESWADGGADGVGDGTGVIPALRLSRSR